MKYDYILKLKSWQDLVRDCEYINEEGLVFKTGYIITQNSFCSALRENYYLYAIDTGFMEALAYFNKDGNQAPYINNLAKQPIWNYILLKNKKPKN